MVREPHHERISPLRFWGGWFMVILMKERISESGVIEDQELAEYYSLMAKKHMRIPCQRVLSRIKGKGIHQGSCLDVGTGPGIFPIFLSKALPEIQFKAIDLSSVMVDIARKNAIEAGTIEKIDFQVGSAYSLPCDDHSLDLLLCINTLHHLDRPADFFNEVARTLKPEGSFVIVDFHRDASFIWIGLFNLFWKLFFGKHPKAKEGFIESVNSSYTLEECRAFLNQSKLRNWKLYTRTIEMWIET
ncbi:MAG: class I SAM-dependent methyltransferase, partial [Deltaproteobacteria bacterium]|nr:class I SAM-dependent methyltransferase [Deltaproteobacteria bacterium]